MNKEAFNKKARELCDSGTATSMAQARRMIMLDKKYEKPETPVEITPEVLNRIWERFVLKTLGEKRIRQELNKLKNRGTIDNLKPPVKFLGSIDKHKEWFFEAVKEITGL